MVNRSANELVEEATGNVKKKHLTKDSGMVRTYLYDGPLIEHLNDGEQPEYVFSHENKGYRITEQDGDERTPHHDNTEGKRYLLITDQRILCVAGCKDGDETIEHTYDEIIDIERIGGTFPSVKFTSEKGKCYKFPSKGATKNLVDEAIDYLSGNISEADPKLAGEAERKNSESNSTVNPSDSELSEEASGEDKGKRSESDSKASHSANELPKEATDEDGEKGLESDSKVNRSASELVKEATGNVKKKHLTKDSGMVRTYLYDGPLIEHLNDGEQPEYVFSHENKGYRITEQDGDERTPHHDSTEGKRYLLITDQRILCVAGCKDGDETIEHTYDEIIDIERIGGNRYGGPYPGFKFVSVNGKSYKFIPKFRSKDLVKGAIEYVSNQIVETLSESNSVTTDEAAEERSSKSPIQKELAGMSSLSTSDIRNILQLDDYDRADETFHHAHGINAVYDDGDQVGGEGGCILATDSRVIAYVNGTFGSANFSMNYNKIHTVEIKHGTVSWDRISVQSDSKTYGFAGFEDVDKSEIHEFADFIRDKAGEPELNDASESNLDPTEQLKNIKELHEQGVLTDEEFKTKKQSLLDKI